MNFLKNMSFRTETLRNALENRFWLVGLQGFSVKNSHLHLLSNLHVLLAPTPVALGHGSRKKWQGYVLRPFSKISCLALLVKTLKELGGCIMKSRGSFHKKSSDRQKSRISRLFDCRESSPLVTKNSHPSHLRVERKCCRHIECDFPSRLYNRSSLRMAPPLLTKFHQRYSYAHMCLPGVALWRRIFEKNTVTFGPRTQAVTQIQVKHYGFKKKGSN